MKKLSRLLIKWFTAENHPENLKDVVVELELVVDLEERDQIVLEDVKDVKDIEEDVVISEEKEPSLVVRDLRDLRDQTDADVLTRNLVLMEEVDQILFYKWKDLYINQ